MIHRYKIIMFDMDGTFIDSKNFHTKVFYRFFNQYVMPVSWEAVETGIGNTVRDIFQSLSVPEVQFEELFAKLDSFCCTQIDDLVQEIDVAFDIEKTLKAIRKKGIKTAVVTNSMRCVTERILKLHKLEKYFSYVSGADIESLNKNQRCDAVRTQALAEKAEVLYVGDAESDIVLANEMGYDGCFVDSSLSWCRNREYVRSVLKPDYTVKNLYEIVNII